MSTDDSSVPTKYRLAVDDALIKLGADIARGDDEDDVIIDA